MCDPFLYFFCLEFQPLSILSIIFAERIYPIFFVLCFFFFVFFYSISSQKVSEAPKNKQQAQKNFSQSES